MTLRCAPAAAVCYTQLRSREGDVGDLTRTPPGRDAMHEAFFFQKAREKERETFIQFVAIARTGGVSVCYRFSSYADDFYGVC